MVLSYNLRILSRNKKRTFFLTLGIIISISLLISVDTANNTISTRMLEEQISEVGIDFRMAESTQYSKSIQSKLDNYMASSDVIKMSLASTYVQFDKSYIYPNGGIIPWNNTFTKSNINWNQTQLFSFESDYHNITEIYNRLQNIIKFPNNTINLNTTGLYIESQTANRYGLKEGDIFSLGYLYQEYKYNEQNYNLPPIITNYTYTFQNITILGIFEILDIELLREYFHGGYGDYQTRLYYNSISDSFFGNSTFLDSIFNTTLNYMKTQLDETNYIGLYRNFGYNLFADYTQLKIWDTQAVQTQIQDIFNALNRIGLGNYQLDSRLQQIIYSVQSEIQGTRVIMFMITIPVVLLSWFLVRTNFMLTFQQRRRELGLLKSRGGVTPKIKRLFLREALIIGLIGGLIGLFIGKLMTFIVIKIIYAESFTGLTIGNLLIESFADGITTSNWLMSLLGGVAIALIAIHKPLNDFLKLNPVDALQKYQDETEHELTQKKADWVFLILGLVPMVLVLIMTILQESGLMFNYIIYMLVNIFIPLLPFSPFILIYALVKFLCGRSMNIFTKVITKISQLFSKQISVFTTKSILRNQARSARLVFIVAISISFMLLASTVAYSEEQYQKGVQTIETGDGIVINFYSNDMNSSNLEMYSDVFWNKSIELQLQGVNYMYYPQEAGLWEDGEYKQIEYNSDFYGYYGTLPAAVITAQNYSEFIDLQDNWFVRSTAQNMMDKLANTPNAAMMPDFLMNKGYNVGDVIQIRYSSNSTNYTIQDFTIVGFYKYFPLTGNSWYSSGITPIILDIGSIEKAKVGSVKMIIYSDLETAPTPSELISLLQDYDSNIRQMYDYDYGFGINVSDMYLRLMRSITRFLDLESYYMLFIVVAGVGIIMYISIREKSHDMGILRARGIDRGVVFKIQLAEGTTLILLGLIFSLIGIFGAKAILLEFDTLFGYFSSLERDLLVPWGKIAIQLLISLALFVGITGIAVKIESKQSNIGPISELLRIQ